MIRSGFLTVWLFGLGPVLVGGCSPGADGNSSGTESSHSGGGSNADPDSAVEVASVLVDAMCDGFAECCMTYPNTFDRVACESAARAAVERLRPTGEDAVLHLAVVDQCAEELRSAVASCSPIPNLGACRSVYAGTAAIGEPCSTVSDCAPVDGAKIFCVGACAARRTVDLGEACTATCLEWTCPLQYQGGAEWNHEDLACDATAGHGCVDGVCEPLPTEGQPCHADALCAPGHVCTADGLICVADAALGESCEDRECAEGAWCSEGICVSQLPVGAACYKDAQCESGVCDFDETDTEEFCLASAGREWDEADCSGAVSF